MQTAEQWVKFIIENFHGQCFHLERHSENILTLSYLIAILGVTKSYIGVRSWCETTKYVTRRLQIRPLVLVQTLFIETQGTRVILYPVLSRCVISFSQIIVASFTWTSTE